MNGARTMAIAPSDTLRQWLARFMVCAGIAAALAYVAALNSILVGGEILKDRERNVTALDREVAQLREAASRRRSAAWIQSAAASAGLVAVGTIRYIEVGPPSVALAAEVNPVTIQPSPVGGIQ